MAGKILIVDDTAVNRIVMRVKLGRACYDTSAVADGTSALAALQAGRPDIVLLDLDLPDIPGLEVLARIRRDRSLADLPVIMVTDRADRATRLAALSGGADDILTKPVDDQLLLARIRSLLRRDATGAAPGDGPLWDMADPPATFERPGLIAVVSRRTELCARLSRELGLRTGHAVTPLSREDALTQSDSPAARPEVFVFHQDSGTDLHFVLELRARPASTYSGVVLLCDGSEQAATAFDYGADEVVPVTVDPEELALRVSALMRRTRNAESRRRSLREGLRLAMTDPLTGLHNLRYAEKELALIAERARRSGASFALLFIDIDRFKQVNDRHGHAAGDLVLAAVSRALTAALRPGDMLARIGGEEFLLALPGVDLAQARTLAERLCATVQSLPIDIGLAAGPVQVTVSIGLAIGTGAEPVEGLRHRADLALFSAKSGGRNRVATEPRAA